MELDHDAVDLLVIGGGTAGIVGARTAVRLGARVLLVEHSRTGGDCLWTGCVPSKTLLSVAAGAADARGGTDDGVVFADVRARVAAAISAIEPDDSVETLERAGVTVRQGTARFTGSGEAEIDGRTVQFRQALVATGSEPALPPVPGLDRAHVVTSETVWDLTELPRHLVIIGGGPIACELGQAFARLGSDVVLVARSRILPKEDPDAAAVIRESLTRDGVNVIEDAEVGEVLPGNGQNSGDGQGGQSRIRLDDGREFPAHVVLVAAGRRPRSAELGLDVLGVDLDEKGQVRVDATGRTSNPMIWAAGDVTQNPKFTHVAGVHASTAASNAVLGVRRKVSQVVPRVTYTSPEVAAVGITSAGRSQRVSTIEYAHTDRAITEDQGAGFVRLVMNRRGRILGGTIVGPRAGESLGELTLAVSKKLTTLDLAGITHPYPTYNDAVWNAAIADARSALGNPLVRTLMSGLVRLTRWRADRR